MEDEFRMMSIFSDRFYAALKSRWDWMLSTFNPNMKNSYGD